jgi:hypothetical protein
MFGKIYIYKHCDVKNTCINNNFPIELDAKPLKGH